MSRHVSEKIVSRLHVTCSTKELFSRCTENTENSDIGIVILYIVKYIRKAFSLPKKINFEVQNLTNIHVFRFAFSDLYCYHTDLQNARNAVSDNLIFKISRGGMPPDPPSKERLRRSLVRIINWSHPPVKNPGYGPGYQCWLVITHWKSSEALEPSLAHSCRSLSRFL